VEATSCRRKDITLLEEVSTITLLEEVSTITLLEEVSTITLLEEVSTITLLEEVSTITLLEENSWRYSERRYIVKGADLAACSFSFVMPYHQLTL